MPRGRKNKSLDERIQDTQQSIYNLEVRTQELYEELEELLRQKKNEELEKLSDALEEAGVSVDEVLAQLKTDVQENIAQQLIRKGEQSVLPKAEPLFFFCLKELNSFRDFMKI